MVINNESVRQDKPRQVAAREALDQLRNRLLDLTARNRLLNFRHSKTGSLRVVDELPDQLLGLLLDNKELRFAAVPLPLRDQLIEAGYLDVDPESSEDVVLRESPTPVQWAAYLGLSVDYKLPCPMQPVPVQPEQAELFSEPAHSAAPAITGSEPAAEAPADNGATTAQAAQAIDDQQTDNPATATLPAGQGERAEWQASASDTAELAADPDADSRPRPAKHTDAVIQTLLYPDQLEALVRTLYQKAESAVQEMGTNILYLSFGFLEWFEADKSDVPRLAPLLLLPVTINKGRLNKQAGTFEYRLSYSGEDIVANLSLLEKLRNDFGLALPPLTEEDLEKGPSAEAYFEKIAAILEQSKPDWCVRRYVTLSLLNFHKLLMYLDLDPERWPEQGQLASHPVVAQFLGVDKAQDNAAAEGFSREHDIDELKDVHRRYPIIYDADSSQHSAIIDVIDGNSLVIEGPPGTGKSQSITNLIAAAISDGKRVLFVAEKLAALQVVKSRLDRAGLGDFCLELHSHKTQKRQFLNALQERLNAHGEYRDSAEIESDISRYEAQKQQLKSHVELINREWKNTGVSPYQVFTAATRYRDTLPLTTLLPGHGSDASAAATTDNPATDFSPRSRQQVRDQIDRYSQIFRTMESQTVAVDPQLTAAATGLTLHPWYGVRRDDLMHQQAALFTQSLADWQQALVQLIEHRDSLAQQLQCEHAAVALSVADMQILADGMQSLPDINANIRRRVLPRLQDETFNACSAELQLFEKMHAAKDALLPAVRSLLAQNAFPDDRIERCAEKLSSRLHPEVTLGEARQLAEITSNTIARGNSILHQLQGAALDAATQAQTVLGHSSIESIEQSRRFLAVLAELDPMLSDRRDRRFENDQLDSILPQLAAQVRSVHQQKDSLSEVFDVRKLGDQAALRELHETLDSGGLFGWLKRDWRSARARLKSIAASASVSGRQLQASLPMAIEFSASCAEINEDSGYSQLLGTHFNGVNTDVSGLQNLRNWYRKVPEELSGSLRRALTELPLQTEQQLRAVIEQGGLQALQQLVQSVYKIRTALLPGDLLHNGDIPVLGEHGALMSLDNLLINNVSACREVLGSDNISITEINNQLKVVDQLQLTEQQWHDEIITDSALGRVFELDLNTLQRNGSDHGAIHATLAFVEALDQCSIGSAVKNVILQSPQQYTVDELRDIANEIQNTLLDLQQKNKHFMQAGSVDPEDWQKHCGSDLQLLFNRNRNALNHESGLSQWMSYLHSAAKLHDFGLVQHCRCCEHGDLAIDQLDHAWLATAYDQLAREILRECPLLAGFSGEIQQTLRHQFAATDLKIQSLQRERIAWKADQNPVPEGVSGAYVRDLTELKLLRHECNKKTRHIPIRQLLSRASNALVQLKPCFMMGPLSAAQYLQPGQLEFDLVIMDEASQIKPEDSLGVIARGRQLVVVGDPKQLPPTNFFDRMVEDEDDDVTVLGEQESILDATIPMFNRRRLRWHYRSQHESLIAFSNQNFYDNDLVLFPSPARQSAEFGVKHVPVNGLFVGRTNTQEALAIAEAVATHFESFPADSIGVVAMNSNQRQLIDATLEAKAKDDPLLREALENNLAGEEPLFVKNLENVQGDERDVILISMTYGPAQQGARVYQRFGPINSDSGWRRLNVLLTRSRKRMQVFTSMASSDIVAGATSKRGVTALRDLLAYLETGIVHNTRQTGRQPDSDFEIAVIERLEKLGYTCVPQIGVAGFFIDIAIVDPANEGHYLMGIECDGAAYHSARTVRDRDRLREAVLERLGWRIRRIWSTDWFKDPDTQIQRIVHELDRLIAAARRTDDSAAQQLSGANPENNALHLTDAPVSDYSVADDKPSVEPEVQQEVSAPPDVNQKLLAPVIDLQQELTKLARLIEQQYPDHSARQRLLRSSMQEALLEFKPVTVQEFETLIPGFLRRSISPVELSRFLPDLLATIAAAR